MNWEAISAVSEIIGALAVLITLIYLALQIRQNTEQAKLNSIKSVNASNDSAFEPIYIPENSIIFTKSQESYEDLSNHEKQVFDMLMTRLIASFDATTYQYSHRAYDENLYWGTANFYYRFITSPGGAKWWDDYKALFSKTCVNNLEKAESYIPN